MRRVRIALAQVNPTVGALEANARMVVDWMGRARALGCDVVAFPELGLTGYPPEDLPFQPAFIAANICEDIWYPTGPTTAQALAGAELVVTINASPYHAGKARFREQMLATRAADDLVCLAFVNAVGAPDPAPGAPPAVPRPAATAPRSPRGAAGGGLPGARRRDARLRQEERLQPCGDRALRRYRLGGGGGP